MAPRLHHHKGALQLFFGICLKNTANFCVNRADRRRTNAKEHNSPARAFREGQRAEILVARHQQPPVRMRKRHEIPVVGPCQARLCRSEDLMPEPSQELHREPVNVLIGEELHEPVLT